MGGMFKECSSLEELNFYSFETKNVTNMNSMFKGCESLISLPDISRWDTFHATKYLKFNGCISCINIFS